MRVNSGSESTLVSRLPHPCPALAVSAEVGSAPAQVSLVPAKRHSLQVIAPPADHYIHLSLVSD